MFKWTGTEISQNLAAFLMAAAQGMFLVALPFAVLSLGYAEREVGLALGLNFAAYLVTCLLSAARADRFNARRTLQLSSAIMVLVLSAIVAVTYLHARGHDVPVPLVIVTAASTVLGCLIAFYWPVILGWVSATLEGPSLNRRLGGYNASWSFGLMVSPLLAGSLCRVSPALALAAAAATMVITLLCLTLSPKQDTPPHAARIIQPDEPIRTDIIARLLPMARIGMVTSLMCVGLARSVLAVLFKTELGFSESDFGIAMCGMCLATFCIYSIAGRSHGWHYRVGLFLLSQLILAGALAIMALSQQLWLFLAAVILIGVGQAFVLVSHTVYVMAGNSRRFRSTAVQEALAAAGLGLGALAGGFIADSFSSRAPYWFGCGVVLAGSLAQCLIWFTRGRRPNSSAPGPTPDATEPPGQPEVIQPLEQT